MRRWTALQCPQYTRPENEFCPFSVGRRTVLAVTGRRLLYNSSIETSIRAACSQAGRRQGLALCSIPAACSHTEHFTGKHYKASAAAMMIFFTVPSRLPNHPGSFGSIRPIWLQGPALQLAFCSKRPQLLRPTSALAPAAAPGLRVSPGHQPMVAGAGTVCDPGNRAGAARLRV
jgi:hypothetical protein